MLRRFLFLLALIACCSQGFAQSTSASLTGLVEDPSKALIPGATITAINTQTGEKASTTTNKEGQYVLPGLNPGTYRLEVDKPGFKGIIEAGLTLHVQDAVQINFHMAVGSSSESVTVTADQINMNTTDGTVSTVIDQSYIANMPLNGRSFQDLILLTPGVVTNSPQSASAAGVSGEFSVNGQRTEANYYTVDGVSANVGTGPISNSPSAGPSGSLGASTALGTTQGLTSVDSLQEFRVQSSSYSAEYGRNPGGQFAFETKSGTKQVHGSALEYLRNGYFDAADWFNDYFGIPYPDIHQNDFGGTFGGPVRVPRIYDGGEKTFFFASYEGLRLLSPQAASINYVFDQTLRTTAASALQPALNADTVANGPDLGDGTAEFIGSWSNPSSIDAGSIRLDHSVNDKIKLFFRFNNTVSSGQTRPVNGNGGGAYPSNPDDASFTLRTYTLGANGTIGKGFTNEFRLNYSSNSVLDSSILDSIGGATPVNLAAAAGAPPATNLEFAVLLDNNLIFMRPYQTDSSLAQWNVVDTSTLQLGHHSVKFGIDYRRLASTLQQSPNSGVWYFQSEAGVLTNTVALEASASSLQLFPLYTNFSAFAQDEWQLSHRLNFSFGLRWDVNPPPAVTKGLRPYTLTGLSDTNAATLAPYGTPLWDTTWFNFAPRFGVAYKLGESPNREAVLRGGGGLFFDTGQQLGSSSIGGGPGMNAVNYSSSGSYPVLAPFPVVQNPPVPPYTGQLMAFAPHLQLPYTLQWNLSLQQSLGQSQSATISYVGSHGSRLLQSNFVQPPNNPNISNFYLFENGGTSDYNSLQAQFQRRLSAGMTAIASYTWSHCFDEGSSNLAIGYQRGNCDMDVRNNFSAAGSYNIPAQFQNDFAKAVLGNWGWDNRFTARTGFPITLTGQQLIYPNGQIYDAGLDVVSGQPIYLYGSNCTSTFLALQGVEPGQACPGGRGINPNAFANATSGLGDAARNFARGFGAIQFDTAIRREFPINDRIKFQFRAEAFNVLNHPNFGNVNGGFGSNTFGLASATLAESLGTLSPLYQMGGPRSMQFSLRLGF